MYDTINLKLPIHYLNPNELYTLEDIKKRLGGDWAVKLKSKDNKSGMTYWRYCVNYRVELNQFGLFFYGSLCKYYHQNNYQTLTIAEIKRAVEAFSSEFQAPLEKAVVTRIDFAINIVLDYPVPLFLASFDFKRKRSMYRIKNSLYYERTGRKLVFYDKFKELKKKHLLLEDTPVNLLRYELRLDKLKYTFRGKDVLFGDLCKKELYDACLKKWVKSLFEVYPGLNSKGALKDFSDITSLRRQLFLMGIEKAGGLAEVLEKIDLMWKFKRIKSEKTFCYCKKVINSGFLYRKEYDSATNFKDRLVKEMKRKLIQGALVHSRS